MKLRLLLLLAPLLASASTAPPPLRADAAIRLRPISLSPGNPARRAVGRLRFVGGWELTSDNVEFGGLSALAIDDDRVTMLSDAGLIARFTLDGVAALDPDLRWLPGLYGRPSPQRDTEALAVDRAGGHAWIGFEHLNEVRRYDAGLAQEEVRAAPPAMAEWPRNGGSEALLRLRNGRFLIFSERGGASKTEQEALLFAGDPTDPRQQPVRFRYRPPAGFVPTDAAELPDGRVAVLNRRFTLWEGVAAALTIVDPRAIVAGEVLGGDEIARLAPPLAVDNMEALAVTAERGRTMLWLASDDNYNALQRSLLMKFELVGRDEARPQQTP